jgi:predicted transposase/invertase (TIGR01784 family)
MAKLQDRPQALQEKIFQELFAAAEIAKYSKEEKELYEESLKYYRDLKNVVDTAYEEGEVKGKMEGRIEGKIEGKIERNCEVAKGMKAKGIDITIITEITGLSEDEIEKLE